MSCEANSFIFYFSWRLRNLMCQIKPLLRHRFIKHWSIFNPHIFSFIRALWYKNTVDWGQGIYTVCWCAPDLVPEPKGQMEEDGNAEGHRADGVSWLAASRSTFVLLPGNPSVCISKSSPISWETVFCENTLFPYYYYIAVIGIIATTKSHIESKIKRKTASV